MFLVLLPAQLFAVWLILSKKKKPDTGQNRRTTGHPVLDISQSLCRVLSKPHGPPKCYLWLILRPLVLHFIHIIAKRTYKTI